MQATSHGAPALDRRVTLDHFTPGAPSPRRLALIAGGSYVGLFLLAIAANFIVIEGLTAPSDPSATVANITASAGLFRLGIAAFLVITILDVVIAWALHQLLQEVEPGLSLLAAWFRVLHSVFLGVGLASLFRVDELVRQASDGAALAVATEVMTALDTFDGMWMVGLAFFALHLVLIAFLLTGPRRAPRALRGLLVLAGAAYLVDTLLHVVVDDYETIAGVMMAIVALPSVVGEGWFGGWLLLRGGRAEVAHREPDEGRLVRR